MFCNKKVQKTPTQIFEEGKDYINKKLELHRREGELQTDIDIQTRKNTNWTQVDDVRSSRMTIIEGLKSEVAKLEAKKESLSEIITANEKLHAQKDAEIKRMGEVITLLINKQPSVIIQQTK